MDDRIDPNDPAQLADWAARLGVQPQQVRFAIDAVGGRPDAVAGFLGRGLNEREEAATPPGHPPKEPPLNRASPPTLPGTTGAAGPKGGAAS